MGGDRCFPSSCSSEDGSFLEDDNPSDHSQTPQLDRFGSGMKHEDHSINNTNWLISGEFDELGSHNSPNPIELNANLRRRRNAFEEIEQSYADLCRRSQSFSEAKSKILSYVPGSWIDKAGNMKFSDYFVPTTTVLLLVGPKGSGKSSLVNRISRVFDYDKFASERAQVSYNSAGEDGTYFLQEYMIPKNSTSFCLFDTRSLSNDLSDNNKMLCNWMTEGVRHGELVVRSSDSSSLRYLLKCKAHASGPASGLTRKVNYVIFVVNGLSVLRSMKCENEEGKWYMKIVAEAFRCPYLSFRDDKPVIVVTHGDLLTSEDRASVRVFLGEQLGVPPAKQLYDIPEKNDAATEMAILDMIRHSLEHADRSLPRKNLMNHYMRKVVIYFVAFMFLLVALLFGIAAFRLDSSYHEPWLRSQGNPNSSQPQEHHVTSSELPMKFHADNLKRSVDQLNGRQGPLKSGEAGRAHQTRKHQDHLGKPENSENQCAHQLNEHKRSPSKPGKSKYVVKYRQPPSKYTKKQHRHEHRKNQKAGSKDTVNWDVIKRLWLADD